MRSIGIVTTARADYGMYQPLLAELSRAPDLKAGIFVGGMHLSARHGMTVRMIEADGYEIAGRIDYALGEDDSPAGISEAMGRGVSAFARAFVQRRPDILVVLGDRFDMLPAALAALPMKIPVAHIHGGEVTEGAMDDVLRHCLTKLSHLHFPTTEAYGLRIVQMGEAPWRVTVSGSPSLDRLRDFKPLPHMEMERRFGLDLSVPPLLATFHPVTLEFEAAAAQVAAFLGGIEDTGAPAVFTLPNADTGGNEIAAAIREFVSARPAHRIVENFGSDAYFSMMTYAAAMVGNSSSGLIEAPSLGLPVVNIGSRQRGRIRAANVLDVPPARSEIAAAIRRAVAIEFRSGLRGLCNPYGDGSASPRIVAKLRETALDDRLLIKSFYDLPAERLQ